MFKFNFDIDDQDESILDTIPVDQSSQSEAVSSTYHNWVQVPVAELVRLLFNFTSATSIKQT
jgi:predicted phosphoribosyltransferase